MAMKSIVIVVLLSAGICAENKFFDLAMKYNNVAPSCVTLTLEQAYPEVDTNILWENLTVAEQKTVIKCHSTVEPYCYNGFFKFVDRGYSAQTMDSVCSYHQTKWGPCCNGTDPRLWRGPFKAFCPLYMGNCFESETNGQQPNITFNYTDHAAPGTDRFNELCPNFQTLCNSTSTIDKAIHHIDICSSLRLSYQNDQNCERRYASQPNTYRMEGCKKYKAYCQPLHNTAARNTTTNE